MNKLIIILLFISFSSFGQKGANDVLVFGNEKSEKVHETKSERSEAIKGGFGESARVLLPNEPVTWEGGSVTFKMKVDPGKQNYFTGKFWGSEANPNFLVLFIEGKQIGYHHLGDIDVLYMGDASPAFIGRFFYNTTPLPISLTKGKREVLLEIKSRGPYFRYGQTFEQYQKNMEKPSCGIYKAYTHTDGYFVPPANDKQGNIVKEIPVRKEPGVEVLQAVKDRVNRNIDGLMNAPRFLEQEEMVFLAKAYHVKWTSIYRDKKVIPLITKSIDEFYRRQVKDPKLVTFDPQEYNPDWFGFGSLGNVVKILENELSPSFEEQIDSGNGNQKTRRQAWAEMFMASKEYLRTHRRQYTNQTMIIDLNLYLSNKALSILEPSKAFSEKEALRYLHEAVGLLPWLGSDTNNGPEKPLGDHYYQLTKKNLTKELGYVAYYGEVMDWMTNIYLATCKTEDISSGDQEIRKKLADLGKSRAIFRYPSLDDEGNKAMRIETIVGWRDMHYPGDVTYSERVGWDASPFLSVMATMDPEAIGYAKQMLEDHQFFKGVERQMKTSNNLRVTKSLLPVPDQYEIITKCPDTKFRLPMSPGQPDFVWGDDEDGVVAIKNGSEILYVSLYWRARSAVNNLARVHFITPNIDRIAVVKEETKFPSSGLEYIRKDFIDFGFGNGGHQYPVELHSAHAGEKLQVAKIPDGVKYEQDEENIYAGKASFYKLQYGNYLIAMNTTTDQTFELDIPSEFEGSKELSNKGKIINSRIVKVTAGSVLVLYSEQK